MYDCPAFIVGATRMVCYRPGVLCEHRDTGGWVVLASRHASPDALERVRKSGVTGPTAIREVFGLPIALVAVEVHNIQSARSAAQDAPLQPPDGLLRAVPFRPISYAVNGFSVSRG